jgi:CheY-like chemotaxis protein
MLLISSGYDVATAEDGFSALQQLRRTVPALIISDLNMPRMSGYELLSVVRRRFPQIMTIAMSGDYRGDTVPEGVIADGFFAKGESPRGLLPIIAVLVRSPVERASAHQKEVAPAWILRNGNDSKGIPYVVVSCAECLRTFQVQVVEATTGTVLEASCHFCAARIDTSLNRWLQEATSCSPEQTRSPHPSST